MKLLPLPLLSSSSLIKLHFISLGCAKNLVDSEKILGRLGASGITVTDSLSESDIVVLNTCGFIKPALHETENVIRKIRHFSESKKIYVYGCAVTRSRAVLKKKFPWVDGWYGLNEQHAMLRRISARKKFAATRLLTTGGYAYLKIADGCSNCCAYCTIPMIKGRYHSLTITDLVDETKELARLGTKEIILIAQDTSRYGLDTYKKPMLVSLIRSLSRIHGIHWIRLMYAHPKTVDDDLIAEIATNPKVCKYLDLPIQHINDRMLGLMNRHVSRHWVEDLVRKLKSIDRMTLRTTVIAGFPTETEKEFRELYTFLDQGYFDWLGVFPYYREIGTVAAGLPQHSPAKIEQRYRTLALLQKKIIREKNRLRLHNIFTTLVHRCNAGFIGHTEFSAPETDGEVHILDKNVRIGDFCNLKVNKIKDSELYGHIE